MNRWDHIEHAAADRRATDLRTAKLAHQLRVARDDQPKQRWLSKLLHRRSTEQEPAADIGIPADALAKAASKAH